ncbi:unnamed protein product [Fructobacillus tropaeoli]|jgi:hypothetical protein|uniref:Uncharacterized protein n=2 Tax=Fructobacillus TaxID=559173 RepID=A0ABN9YS36_9LACO|nr:hypothetical protein FEFB_04230 [Fructobacillus sp. EFB-N1]CAK1222034.1 unnamed protein product [Fructobacillus cardui]CAK1241751.1 unnamed protein product [Fructobacillus tropaeoli]CAK1238172.1 unnamed protein product [Fructobacillus cardui]CAK1244448.1 unnamed protein product [Fructobacillus cardui]
MNKKDSFLSVIRQNQEMVWLIFQTISSEHLHWFLAFVL